MKRRIVLMRHAKSSWKTDAPTDHARPLNKRGRRDAPRIGQKLSELGWAPERVLSSDSQRTRETYAGMEKAFAQSPPKVTFLRELYHASINEVRIAVSALPDEVEIVLVLGHNPGCEEVLTWLSEAEEIMTTANAALLEGEGKTWDEAMVEQWQMRQLLRPKEL